MRISDWSSDVCSSDLNAVRARAIELSVAIRAVLEPCIRGHIAKWDDTFNPRAFGDLTQQSGVSTVLIESGGIAGDLQKQRLRKPNFLALAGALAAIATGSYAGPPTARDRKSTTLNSRHQYTTR